MSRRGFDPLFVVLSLAALGWGTFGAVRAWWTTDDAYISFRYAEHLAEGSGLVFNPGERVEGFTNLLWTVWIAVGLMLGAAAEAWANTWSVIAYVASIALLLGNHLRLRAAEPMATGVLPVAALAAAVHPDWNIFATSGLETSLFTALLLLGVLLVAGRPDDARWLVSGGVVFGLASVTRPDGLLPAVVAGAFLLFAGRPPRWRSAAWFAAAFAVVWAPCTVWRFLYYGDIVPNTYYAKSADAPYYEQGIRYLLLYAERYWMLFAGVLTLPVAWLLSRRDAGARSVGWPPLVRRQIALSAAVASVYALYVVRVGGDFMFARFLIPVTPFVLLLLEIGWSRVFRRRPALGLIGVLLLLALMRATPAPFEGGTWRHGIANEWTVYNPRFVAQLERKADVLRDAFEGLPVRVAFYGTEARIVYRADIPVAIESHGGLTEPAVARGPLAKRGRVGHEKMATLDYLVVERRAHFTFMPSARQWLDIPERIPDVIVDFGRGVRGQTLHWDPAIMAALRERGAQVPDFLGDLDQLIARLPRLPDEQVRRLYRKLELFYFTHTDDPIRQAAFLRRIERAS